jgi:predicted metal-dependent peptidase
MQPAPIEPTEIDINQLNRELDRTKSHVFRDKNAGFLGALMCYLNFMWLEDIPTAATDGVNFFWNPIWFLSLEPDTRKTVLMHELWHVAYIHIIRKGNRDHLIWNYACDIVINNMLENEGYSFKGVEGCWKDQSYGEQPAEQIYDQLIQKQINPPCSNPFGSTGKATYDPNGPPQPQGDMHQPSAGEQQQVINNVVQAAHSARMSGQAGSIPGEVETHLKTFLATIIPWETLLHKFFQDLLEHDFSWQVRDRRYSDIYMPGEIEDEGRLEHLIYYLDVSGSVTDAQVIRFNSEVKFIKETYHPKKLTLVQFDTRITWQRTFLEEDPFNEIVIVGRGGTDLTPVRAHMIEHRPTAAIIFSDLYCAEMQPLPVPVPTIWVAIANRSATVPFGDIIHIKA